MTTARWVLLHSGAAAFGLGGVVLFLSGTVALTSGAYVAGLLPPGVALLAGAAAFMVWFVLFLLRNDAVNAKPRRRRR
ncbi:hypothetical protein [Arthrobacter sp.]|uniref:hypothetical protein n=1 Tax=Arthrobacter sp. TaxID=1667 RepID=UPI0026DFE991|nr:hypothetical protein [Arthrobacter sp.]MDO5752389.1 hypothetical protein [Arthrobacter sp.]